MWWGVGGMTDIIATNFCLLIQNVIKSGQNMIAIDFEVSCHT
jgi:hypothetical protein